MATQAMVGAVVDAAERAGAREEAGKSRSFDCADRDETAICSAQDDTSIVKVHPAMKLWARVSRFDGAMGFLLAGLVVGEFFAARAVRLTGLGQLLDVWPGMLLMAACIGYCRWRPLPRFVASSELALWAVALVNALALAIQIAGRVGSGTGSTGLVDARLKALDAGMGFETAAVVRAVERMPVVHGALAIAYAMVPVLIIMAILLPPFCGYATATRRYIVGIVIGIALTAVIFAVWPAAGPWVVEGLKPSAEQAGVAAYLLRLKAAGPVRLDLVNGAIVSFPSFHVVLAVLSAVAIASVRRLRVGVWVVAAMTCVSTVTTGWHYGVDVLGGLVVAGVSVWGARVMVGWMEKGAAEGIAGG